MLQARKTDKVVRMGFIEVGEDVSVLFYGLQGASLMDPLPPQGILSVKKRLLLLNKYTHFLLFQLFEK
jgi:hypothetical protein